MSEYELKETNLSTIVNIMKSLRVLLARNNFISSTFPDEMLLHYFYNQLTSKNLERRVKGITYINKFINVITKNESAISMYNYNKFINP